MPGQQSSHDRTAVACEACGLPGDHRLFEAREMMFGLRERFTYQECRECGHIQLLDVPGDLARFYPPDYYSLEPLPAFAGRVPGWPTRTLTDLLLRLPTPILDPMTRRGPLVPLRSLSGLNLSTRSRVCDVGCGRGVLLLELWRLGFQSLAGFDPHVADDREVAPSVWVRRAPIEAIKGSFDAILLNHSLEHMPSPHVALSHLRECLSPGGAIVVRVPLAGTYAYRQFGADWVGLDPPRHLFVPTHRSMGFLAEHSKLRVERVFYDSHAMQFWGSEQYRRDIPLRDERSWSESQERSPFTAADVVRWRREARRLNAAGSGDAAGFVLRPSG